MKRYLLKLIKNYQITIVPYLKKIGYRCIFQPTCSEYATNCLRKYNLFKANILIIYRLLSCNPINSFIKLRVERKEKDGEGI